MQKTTNLLRKISSKYYLVLLLIFIFGIFLINLSKYFKDDTFKHIFRDVGIAFLPLSVIGFVYEYILRRSFISEMKAKIDEGLNETMPTSLKHLRDCGIVDAYERLDVQNLKMHIKDSSNIEIKIQDIWFEHLHFLKDDLLRAITLKSCRVRIILCDMENIDVLGKRADSLGMKDGIVALMSQLLINFRTLASMLEHLEKTENTDLINSLQIKMYSTFAGFSLLGIGLDYYMGFYLREKFSSERTQLKISGYNRFFYHHIDDHFEAQWKAATNKEFKKDDLPFYLNFFRDYVTNHAPNYEDNDC